MPANIVALPSQVAIKKHIISALRAYWLNQEKLIRQLPIIDISEPLMNKTLKLYAVNLPDWGKSCGVNGAILVPAEACQKGDNWQQIDWWLASFLMLECWHERCWEQQHGPIHSYSFRLKGWDTRVWDHAWVNRIGLFLRAWAAVMVEQKLDRLFDPIPAARIVMTHDVDAVSKTLPIRIKQGIFNFFNSARMFAEGNRTQAWNKLITAKRFWFGSENWWTFDKLLVEESRFGIEAHFNFYADVRKKTLTRWLLDPGYDVSDSKTRALLSQIIKYGAEVGLHPTFDAWQSAEIMEQQKKELEQVCGKTITTCRQHWLKFSWQKTWAAQQSIGLMQDSTIMFNDRPGFRAAACLKWHPWDQTKNRAHTIFEVPTMMMDSHFYDYKMFSDEQRSVEIEKWVNEPKLTGGEVTVLWHPHTLTNDYGWMPGFKNILKALNER